MNVEGIIIHKTAYKDRDLICKLLLRSGKTVNIYFYGGRGGGKKSKGSIIELGHMLKVTLGRNSNKSDIIIAKEYSLLWNSNFIRMDHRAFYLMNFIFEVVQRISVEEELDDYEKVKSEFVGVFKVVSNILFYIDEHIKEKKFKLNNFLFNFLSKTLQEIGAVPDYISCGHCEVDLNKVDLMRFEAHDGCFTCLDCIRSKDEQLSGNKRVIDDFKMNTNLRMHLDYSLKELIKNFDHDKDIHFSESEMLLNYLCYQFGFNIGQFKTWGMIKTF